MMHFPGARLFLLASRRATTSHFDLSCCLEGTRSFETQHFLSYRRNGRITCGDELGRELSRRALEEIVLTLWDEARQSKPSAQDRALDELTEAIRQQPSKPWNLDVMAREVFLSRAQFVRRFRTRFDSSPMGFLSQVRLERAQNLLLESDLSLDSIARSVGLGDAPQLSKAFKADLGTSPGAWRRLAKNPEEISSESLDSGLTRICCSSVDERVRGGQRLKPVVVAS